MLQLFALVLLGACVAACSYDYDGAIRCDNDAKDGDEADVDCGGSCVSGVSGRCGYGKACNVASDCQEDLASCELGRCTPKAITAKWEKLPTPSKLTPRYGAGLTFYGSAGLLAGGFHKVDGGTGSSITDAWIFFNQAWAKEPMLAPERHYHAQAFDPILASVLIAGGESTLTGRRADSWVRDANNQWTKLSNLPASRVSAAMVYDEPRQRMLLYGEGDHDEVWVRPSQADASWQRLQTTDPPPVPFRHAMAYDAARDRVVVFGGTTDAVSFEPNQRTSLLDPESLSWETLAFSDGPRARWGPGMAYDPARQRVVLFAGRAATGESSFAHNDTWEWDGESWKPLVTLAGTELPPRNFHPAFAYDPNGRRMIAVVGGKAGFNAVSPAETWALSILGWPCSSALDCGEGTFCVDNLCCDSACDGGVCNQRDQPGVCQSSP